MKTPFTRSLAILLSVPCCATLQALEIDPSAQERIGLQTAKLEECEIAPSTPVFGTVLSPASLVDLLRQRETARSMTDLSKQALTRAEKLFTSGELVARKDVEAARAQQIQAEALVSSLDDRITLEWGSSFASMSTTEQADFISGLLARKRFLVRLALPGREGLAAMPAGASFHPGSSSGKPFHTTLLHQATAADPAFQSTAFLAVFESSDSVPAPAPGIAARGNLELSGDVRHGLLVPEKAVIFFQGRAWIYCMHASKNEFQRIEVPIDRPVTGGWCVEKQTIGDDPVVVTGAQILLSEEALAAHPEGQD